MLFSHLRIPTETLTLFFLLSLTACETKLYHRLFLLSGLQTRVELYYQLSWDSSLPATDLETLRLHNYLSQFLIKNKQTNTNIHTYICTYVFIFFWFFFLKDYKLIYRHFYFEDNATKKNNNDKLN